MLATGGAAALWSRTTNPPGSLGIGLGLAHAAGADLADLEFLQFHPTAVIGVPHREGFLVTEAIRGEGATLHGPDGERFVDELAPRDEVARAIVTVLTETGARSVGLDMRNVDPARFPNVVEALQENGVDPTTELIPVSPAAHYMMGGVVTDLDARSTVPGLLAVGETPARPARRQPPRVQQPERVLRLRRRGRRRRARRAAGAGRRPRAGDRRAARDAQRARPARRLWRDAGLVRDADGLRRLLDDPSPLARLIATCALQREESRGAHARSDFPALDPALDGRHAVVGADDRPILATWA